MAVLVAVGSFHSPDDNDLGRPGRFAPEGIRSASLSPDTCAACALQGIAAAPTTTSRPVLRLRQIALVAPLSPPAPDLESREALGSRAPPSA